MTRIPLDIDAVTARAKAAPGGCWAAFRDCLWIPWCPDTDDESYGTWDSGRYLTIAEHDWHAGSEDPPPELFEFLAAARGDVLALAAEVRRLRAALTATTRKEAA